MTSTLPFRTWLRRAKTDDPAAFALRFEVFDGKGVLRVARPGILVDPPARVSGFEDRLTPAQVRASRFLHVWAGGRKRQSHILSRLADADLQHLEAEAWVELVVQSDAGYRYLQLPEGLAGSRTRPLDRQGRPLEPAPRGFDEEEVTEVRPGLLDVPSPGNVLDTPQAAGLSRGAQPISRTPGMVPGTMVSTGRGPDPARAGPPTATEQVADKALQLGGPPPTVLVRLLRRAMERQRLELFAAQRAEPSRPSPARNLAGPSPVPPKAAPRSRGFDEDDDEGHTQLRGPPKG